MLMIFAGIMPYRSF